MDALRYHITKGHCKHFDPRKQVPEVAISHELKAAMLTGRLGPYLREAGARTFLTVHACVVAEHSREHVSSPAICKKGAPSCGMMLFILASAASKSLAH